MREITCTGTGAHQNTKTPDLPRVEDQGFYLKVREGNIDSGLLLGMAFIARCGTGDRQFIGRAHE